MNTIAERIKFAMKAKNKKQVDIVKDTGISKGAFSSYLSGQYNPKADKMELIADSLDVDLRWLYGQNVPMEHTSQNDNALQYVFYNNSCSEYLLDNLDDNLKPYGRFCYKLLLPDMLADAKYGEFSFSMGKTSFFIQNWVLNLDENRNDNF